jgi:hypothetical protein
MGGIITKNAVVWIGGCLPSGEVGDASTFRDPVRFRMTD